MSALTLAVFLATHVSLPQVPVLTESVDMMEVNHYHDHRGEHVFDQLIFYDWSSQKKRYDVRAWRLIKSEHQYPRRDHRRGIWTVRWHDGGVLREVTSRSRRETWTKYDPELLERDNLPAEQRLELKWRPQNPQWHASAGGE